MKFCVSVGMGRYPAAVHEVFFYKLEITKVSSG